MDYHAIVVLLAMFEIFVISHLISGLAAGSFKRNTYQDIPDKFDIYRAKTPCLYWSMVIVLLAGVVLYGIILLGIIRLAYI